MDPTTGTPIHEKENIFNFIIAKHIQTNCHAGKLVFS